MSKVNKNKKLIFPLDDINDGYSFQQIVAEYFRVLKLEKLNYQIADVLVEDNGVGGDDGCDIMVEFYFEDAINRHSQRWVVECKSQNRAVSLKDINTNNIESILKSKSANGYLLVCKNDATASLKRIFSNCNKNSPNKYIVWNGSQLWHKLIKHLSLIEAFFPSYYRENYLANKAEDKFNTLVKKFEAKLKEK